MNLDQVEMFLVYVENKYTQVYMKQNQVRAVFIMALVVFGAGVISCVHNTDDEEEDKEQTTVGEEIQVKVTSSTELAKEIMSGQYRRVAQDFMNKNGGEIYRE